jgi:hypothetical protein
MHTWMLSHMQNELKRNINEYEEILEALGILFDIPQLIYGSTPYKALVNATSGVVT